MAEGETFGAWLSGETLRRAKARAKGNNSRYVRALIERDLEGELDLTAQNVLVELAKKFQPATADQIQALCYEADGTTVRVPQARLLGRLLDASLTALRAQKEKEGDYIVVPKSAIQAEITRVRELEDAFMEVAAFFINQPARAAEQGQGGDPPRKQKGLRSRSHGTGPDASVSKPA